MSAPRPRRPSTTVAIRSDSFSAQLLRALDDRLALGEAAEQRDERQLVDRERDLVGGHARADERAVRDVELAHRLGVGRGARRGLLEVAEQHGAHALEDAEEADAGPVRRHPLDHEPRAGDEHGGGGVEGGRGRVAGDVDRVERELVLARDRDARRRRARCRRRRAASSRSVWSRLGSGSTTVVVPSASSPASSTQLLTCAEATGSSYSIPCSRRPAIASGVKRSSRARSSAPICASGRATRSTGRRRMLSSPSSVQLPSGCPASQPGSSRSSVPALPTSIATPGVAAAQAGAADDHAAVARSSTSAPSARTASSDERVSAASR